MGEKELILVASDLNRISVGCTCGAAVLFDVAEDRTEEPTKAMRTEAASAGFYKSPWGTHPKLQIVTVGDLLGGKKLDAPPSRQTSVTYKRAPKALQKAAEQRNIFGQDED